jgi:predicted HicB family RNase H-like nuclease
MKDEMKSEYDFTHGTRGKFYRPGAKLHLPVYLEEQLQKALSAAAERKGTSLNELVNTLLNKEVSHEESNDR